jgi:hypothetical protein
MADHENQEGNVGVAAHPAPLAETEFAVVDCGSGMQRLDWPSGAWWHQLPAGRYRLIAVPLGVREDGKC